MRRQKKTAGLKYKGMSNLKEDTYSVDKQNRYPLAFFIKKWHIDRTVPELQKMIY